MTPRISLASATPNTKAYRDGAACPRACAGYIKKGIDRDRAVDESGNQLAVFRPRRGVPGL